MKKGRAIACPEAVKECSRCASHVEWSDGTSQGAAFRFRALREAEVHLLRGAIIGLCSHGRSHMIADARREAAVEKIRSLAGSGERPLPLMFQTTEAAGLFFDIPARQRETLADPMADPLVLPRKKTWKELPLAHGVNPAGSDKLPVMVSKTTLHFLLLGRIESPVVAVEVDRFDENSGDPEVPVLALDCPAYRWLQNRTGPRVVCVRGRVDEG